MKPSESAHLRNLLSGTFERLPKVIGSLGEETFGNELMELLSATCGAQHYNLFRITKQSPAPVVSVSRDGTDTARRQFGLYVSGSYWRKDSFMAETIQSIGPSGVSMGHLDTAAMLDRDFRERLYGVTHVGERILLCGRTKDEAFGLSILRSQEQGQASFEERSCLASLSTTLVSILNKHITMVSSQMDVSLALTSLPEIEDTLLTSSVQLPRREVEVCARILYGMSTTGIALDLGIGEETVGTYRKRTYQRLSIGSQRELLVWYLREWSSNHSGAWALQPRALRAERTQSAAR
jgi:DNA-binding CsgD family transcriptional regulator